MADEKPTEPLSFVRRRKDNYESYGKNTTLGEAISHDMVILAITNIALLKGVLNLLRNENKSAVEYLEKELDRMEKRVDSMIDTLREDTK